VSNLSLKLERQPKPADYFLAVFFLAQ